MGDLYLIRKARNWKKIVKTLKDGPSFGIHGTEHKNLADILSLHDRGKFIMGHFCAVGSKQKLYDDDNFYEKLWLSLNETLSFSRCFVDTEKTPTVILGISPHEYIDDSQHSCHTIFGKSRETFSVGHDFPSNWQLRPIVIEDKERLKLLKERDEYVKSLVPSNGLRGLSISSALKYNHLITNSALQKVYETMKEFEPAPKN